MRCGEQMWKQGKDGMVATAILDERQVIKETSKSACACALRSTREGYAVCVVGGEAVTLLARWNQICCENASGLRYDEIWHAPFFAASVMWAWIPDRDLSSR